MCSFKPSFSFLSLSLNYKTSFRLHFPQCPGSVASSGPLHVLGDLNRYVQPGWGGRESVSLGHEALPAVTWSRFLPRAGAAAPHIDVIILQQPAACARALFEQREELVRRWAGSSCGRRTQVC